MINILWHFVTLIVWSPVAVVISFLLYIRFIRVTHFWEVPGVDYIKSHILFGDFYKVLVNKEHFVMKMKDLYDTIKGPIGGFYMFIKPVVMVRDPDLIIRILITDIDKFTDRGLLTSNLLVFKGEQWKPITDKLPTVMLKEIQKREFDVLEKTSLILQNHVAREIKIHDIMDVRELMTRFATAAMKSIVFSNEIDSINNPDDMFCKMGRLIATPNRKGQLRSLLAMTMPNLVKLLKIHTVEEALQEFLHTIINYTLELRESGKVVEHDYLQLLVQLRNGGKFNDDGKWDVKSVDENRKTLTINEVVMHVFLFYVFEFDAASAAMTFALFEIARNKEILTAIQAEIDEVVIAANQRGLYGFRMSPELFNRMKYVDKVVFETLRKYPSVPVVLRSPLKPYKIPNTEIILDEKQEIFIPVYGIHHDPKYYSEPSKFNPWNFYVTYMNKREPGTYFPLGDASPDWIRSSFTFLQIKMAIVAICSKFNVELASDSSRDLQYCNTLNLRGKLNLRLTLRNEGFCRSM